MMLSSLISMGDAIRAAQELKQKLVAIQSDVDQDNDFPFGIDDPLIKEEMLRNAAAILKSELDEVTASCNYPLPTEIDQTSSQEFIPTNLNKFIMWLVDPKSYGSTEYTSSVDNQRKVTAISECIIHVSQNVTTPLHLGLAIQIHHDFGSRQLIDILHSYGYCVSYEELRLFMTSLGNKEMSRIDNGIYIPSSVIPIREGGSFISEGDDNIDLNVETINGKNSFHSMARVIFQNKPADFSQTRAIKVIRGKDRSLKVEPQMQALLQTLPFEKPRQRPEPPRWENALKQIEDSAGKGLSNETDIGWVVLRMACRGLFFAPLQPQTISAWTEYNKARAVKQETFTSVAYAPVIDAKPADMATVFTTMIRCKEMTNAMGQRSSVQTFDQQLYAIAQQVKWCLPDRFENHVLRLGGFHQVTCFIASIGKIWGDAGLHDLLVDSETYAPNTTEQMLSGKQYHRAVRGLTLSYEVLMQALIIQCLKWCVDNEKTNFEEHVKDIIVEILDQSESGNILEGNIGELSVLVKDVLLPNMMEFR